MADKTVVTEEAPSVGELQQTIVDLNTQIEDLTANANVSASVLMDYQQQLANAMFDASTSRARLSVALQKLAAASAAQ